MAEPTFTLKQLADALAGVSQAETTETTEAPQVAEDASPQYVTKADLDSFKSELLESLQGSNPAPATPPSQVLSPPQGLTPAKNPQINLPVSPATQPVKNGFVPTGNPVIDQRRQAEATYQQAKENTDAVQAALLQQLGIRS